MSKGRVYWITGLSNSGKTTIGSALYYDLKKIHDNVILLDGDIMKQIASSSTSIGYSTHDRYIRAKRYSLMSKLLSDQGAWVIVCAIAMYDEIRAWNRDNIYGYIEVFLDVPSEILKQRDKKSLVENYEDPQFPKNPDLTVNNDGTVPVRSIIRQIKALIPETEDDYDRDKQYWNSYYASLSETNLLPSDFAVKVTDMIRPASHIMELGCGNGRDSLYFLQKGHNVIAVDGSDFAIDHLNKMTKDNPNALFVCDDFVKCHALYQMPYDCVYSRFTLHAITEDQENELLSNILEALRWGGILCIEARTTRDSIFGKGKCVDHNAYIYNDHYRRFIDVEEFRKKLISLGFHIISLEEDRGFSKTTDSDPVLMRCIASVDDNPEKGLKGLPA